ncbi:MAG: M48 family metallopeptidase [Clostridia bacterium]|nr:M48 family metallopeptidase [Clostridia bacterium]
MDCEIVYSKRRTVSLKVKDGRVIVRAPLKMKKADIVKILEKHRDWIEKAVAREKASREKFEDLTEIQIKLIKKQARAYLTEKCEYYSKIMGLKYNKISITSAKTRFGSCSSKKNISFSYRIMLYPECAREYVVVHELAHLKEMNHSAAFYGIIEKYMPDYKERRKLLKTK